jgi:hypothetical protein
MVHPECLWCVLNLSVRIAVDVHDVMFERGPDATFDAAQHSPRHQRRNRSGELDFHQVATATYPRATARTSSRQRQAGAEASASTSSKPATRLSENTS